MKERELRKLSRLELLEMLLDITKENRELKEQVEKLNTEIATARGVDDLCAAVKEISGALVSANLLVDDLRTVASTPTVVSDTPIDKPKYSAVGKKKRISERNLYYRILEFYSKNTELLDSFPADIKNELVNKIKSVQADKKT